MSPLTGALVLLTGIGLLGAAGIRASRALGWHEGAGGDTVRSPQRSSGRQR